MGRHKKECNCDKCKITKSNKIHKLHKNTKYTSTECKNKNSKKGKKFREDGEIKRGRGRPRKETKETNEVNEVKEIKGKRGRPSKVNKTRFLTYAEKNILPTVPTRTYKAYGFCPACKLSIASYDIDRSKITCYICPKCNHRGKLTELLKEVGLEKAKTKKEYLQSVNSVYAWHDYSGSSNINTIKKPEHLIEEIEVDEDICIKTDEEDVMGDIDKTLKKDE